MGAVGFFKRQHAGEHNMLILLRQYFLRPKHLWIFAYPGVLLVYTQYHRQPWIADYMMTQIFKMVFLAAPFMQSFAEPRPDPQARALKDLLTGRY